MYPPAPADDIALVDVTITVLDRRWFPFWCCGRTWAHPGELMDHLLPPGVDHDLGRAAGWVGAPDGHFGRIDSAPQPPAGV